MRERGPLAVTGLGLVLVPPGHPDPTERGGPLDVTECLRDPRMRKFMGKQDRLAVRAARQALGDAGLADEVPATRTGLYMAVGYIPFERRDIDVLTTHSLEGGEFSMTRFSQVAFKKVHPLLTFKVLPNMPIFHVSLNHGIQGPYHVGYPGPGQLYGALDRAWAALVRGDVDVALVGGVADQQNFLVRHHFARLPALAGWPGPDRRPDVASFMVLERPRDAAARGGRVHLELEELEMSYQAPEHAAGVETPAEDLQVVEDGAPEGGHPAPGPWLEGIPAGALGPASLPALLANATAGAGEVDRPSGYVHRLRARDGVRASSRWRPS